MAGIDGWVVSALLFFTLTLDKWGERDWGLVVVNAVGFIAAVLICARHWRQTSTSKRKAAT